MLSKPMNLTETDWSLIRVKDGIWVSFNPTIDIPLEGIILTIKDDTRCFVSDHTIKTSNCFIPINGEHVVFVQIGNYAKYVSRTGLDDYLN